MINSILLRKPILSDALTILKWENNPENWSVSDNEGEYSQNDIENLIGSFTSLKAADQMRYLIEEPISKELLGAVDLFDIQEDKASVGVLIAEKRHRNKGIASQSLLLLEDVCLNHSEIRRLNATVATENHSSIALFNKCGYQKVEKRREKLNNGEYIETILFEKWLKE